MIRLPFFILIFALVFVWTNLRPANHDNARAQISVVAIPDRHGVFADIADDNTIFFIDERNFISLNSPKAKLIRGERKAVPNGFV